VLVLILYLNLVVKEVSVTLTNTRNHLALNPRAGELRLGEDGHLTDLIDATETREAGVIVPYWGVANEETGGGGGGGNKKLEDATVGEGLAGVDVIGGVGEDKVVVRILKGGGVREEGVDKLRVSKVVFCVASKHLTDSTLHSPCNPSILLQLHLPYSPPHPTQRL
jgi:hypothetical protein